MTAFKSQEFLMFCMVSTVANIMNGMLLRYLDPSGFMAVLAIVCLSLLTMIIIAAFAIFTVAILVLTCQYRLFAWLAAHTFDDES